MPRKHIFTSLEEVQSYYPFQTSPDFFDDLKPTMKLVELKFILTDIDAATWTALRTEIDALTFTNASWEELASRAMQAVAYLIALYHMDKANVIFSSTGLLVAKTEQTVPASEARAQKLRLQLLKDVQTSLDLLISYLEDNTAVFTDWATSEMRVDRSLLIIPTARQFDDAYTISENRYMFRKLLPSQRRIIDNEIQAHLGRPFLQAYLTESLTGLSADSRAITARLHRAVAYLTMADALPRLQIQFGPEGIAIFDSEYGVQGARRQDSDLNRITFLIDDAREKGLSEITRLKYFLDENSSLTLYPAYFLSPAYANLDVDHTDLNNYGDDTEPKNHFAL